MSSPSTTTPQAPILGAGPTATTGQAQCIRCGQPANFAAGSDDPNEPDLCTRCFPAWLEEQ